MRGSETEGKVVELDPENGSIVGEHALDAGVHKVVLSSSGRSLVTRNPDRGILQSIELGAGSVRTLSLACSMREASGLADHGSEYCDAEA
jgi:hypothetical protein